MGHRNRWAGGVRLIGFAAAALVILGPTGAWAAEEAPPMDERGSDTLGTPEVKEEEAEEKGPNRGRVHFSLTNDITTAYFFRGILQERNGFIWEPSAEIDFNLWEGDGALSSVALGFGIWNSFQTEKTGATGGPTNLYETDYYPSLTLGWAGGFETSVTYNVYTSPNGAFVTMQEVDARPRVRRQRAARPVRADPDGDVQRSRPTTPRSAPTTRAATSSSASSRASRPRCRGAAPRTIR